MSYTLATGGQGTVATAEVVWNGGTYKFRSDNNFLSWIQTIFDVADSLSSNNVQYRQTIWWLNKDLLVPQYTTLGTPTQANGSAITLPTQPCIVTEFGMRIRSIAGVETTPTVLRLYRGGITIDAGTVGVEPNRCSNALTIDTTALSTNITVFTAGQQLTGGKSLIATPTSLGDFVQCAVETANVGNTTLTADIYATILGLPS